MRKMIMMTACALSLSVNAQLAKLFDREVMYQHFSGVAWVSIGDSLVLKYAHGLAGDGKQIHMRSQFDIGSISKQFTAAAILHLVHEKAFGLHDEINPLLGHLASERWKKVTIHHLLTHTSGIPSLYQTEQGLDLFLPKAEPISMNELIARFKDAKLLFKPGEEFSYSNSGYILLAAVIEQVTGISYEQFMEQLFVRYELQQTTLTKNSNVASPYYGYRSDLAKEAPSYHISWIKGAGGIFSNASDLAKWVNIISSDTFLTSELRRAYLKSHTNHGYGYGWVHKGGIISHDGGTAGYTCHLGFNPRTEEKVIILTNRSYENIHQYSQSAAYVQSLAEKSWKVLGGENIEVLPAIKKEALKYEKQFEKDIFITSMDTVLLVLKKDSHPGRIIPNTPLSGNSSDEKKMIDIAKLLSQKKYWSLASHCDGEMKFVMYSGLMSIGMRMMQKQTGKAEEFIPYYVSEEFGIIRMKGPEGILDLIVYFDAEGKVQGVFEHGFYDPDMEHETLAYPIGNSLYYVDGLPYAEKSATFKLTDQVLEIYQMNRKVIIKSVEY